MSGTDKNSLLNSGEGDSVPENEPNKLLNVNLVHVTLHYSVNFGRHDTRREYSS